MEEEVSDSKVNDDISMRVLNSLGDIRDFQREIRSWVRFFGIITIISIVLGIIAGFIAIASAIGNSPQY